MRFPFPERVPLDRAVIFAIALFVIQQVEGTALYFSAGCLAFILLATIAFNICGGLTRPSGGYIFFYAMLVFIVGVCYKAVLWEPAESNLQDPHTTILVYVAGMAGMLLAGLISRKFVRRTGLLQTVVREGQMYRSAWGCLVFSLAAPFLIAMLGSSGARLGSAFNQLNELAPLAILIGVIYEIRRSGGTRSINTVVVIAIGYTFVFYGILGFSKQGLLSPLYCWLVPVCALRYRLSPLQVAGGIVWLLLVFEILVPYSQYGRRFVADNPTISDRVQVAATLLSEPLDMRKKYKETEQDSASAIRYFNGPQGFWDRLTFIAPDDALINVTDQTGRLFGYLPVISSFVNVVPRFIMPNKPAYSFGNMYAHEIGGLPDEDTTTGISFSPTSEAYHMGKWIALCIVAPLVWSLMFIVLDSLIGDTRTTPWGLLALTMLSHLAPETGLEGAIYMMTFGSEILTFCALFSRWVAPLVSIAVLGQEKPAPPRLQLPTGRVGARFGGPAAVGSTE